MSARAKRSSRRSRWRVQWKLVCRARLWRRQTFSLANTARHWRRCWRKQAFAWPFSPGATKPLPEQILAGLASGDIHVVVGTHALFQEEVVFKDLGLIVIDEQHRFGVSDRARMVAKGYAPHVLVMSATPIPRTLALSIHGDMDLSVLDEKPPGRQPIKTATMPTARMSEVIDAVGEAADRGERAYWGCPLIEESEAVDLPAVLDRYEELKARFGKGVEIVHGKMSAHGA